MQYAVQAVTSLTGVEYQSLDLNVPNVVIIGTLRYEDGKARTGTAVDAGNFRGSRRVAKNKMLKMCIFAKDGDFKNSNFQHAILRSNDIL